MRRFTTRSLWALGDTICLSALVRDVHLAYGDKVRLSYAGSYMSLWENNPYLSPIDPQNRGPVINVDYQEGIRASTRGEKVHFLSWFHKDFEKKTGLHVPVRYPRGDIHLSEKEKQRKVEGRYWVIMPGGKLDFTAKVWYPSRWQTLVNRLKSAGINCVQAGVNYHDHFNPKLDNCLSLLGATDSIRDFFSLVYHADGVICGITSGMHLAAVFEKPCVVIAGGREEPWWAFYTRSYFPQAFGPQCAPIRIEHKPIHAAGKLDCCLTRGCWKKRTVPITQEDHTPKGQEFLCSKPVRQTSMTGSEVAPECLNQISVDDVFDRVLEYYYEGTLPWIY